MAPGTCQVINPHCLMVIEFQFCSMKGVLEMEGGDSCTTILIYLMPLNCTLKMAKMADLM